MGSMDLLIILDLNAPAMRATLITFPPIKPASLPSESPIYTIWVGRVCVAPPSPHAQAFQGECHRLIRRSSVALAGPTRTAEVH
jgi:hypothetical protein